MNTLAYCTGVLESLKLQGMASALEDVSLEQELSHGEFLKLLLEKELSYRMERRLKRNLAGAHFPMIKLLEEFEVDKISGITALQLRNLLDFTWIDKQENILFFVHRELAKLMYPLH